jgi:hypothetical protein
LIVLTSLSFWASFETTFKTFEDWISIQYL